MKVRIGITGTREGFFQAQENRFRVWLENSTRIINVSEIHHGDCIGCDVEAANIIKEYYPEAKKIGHPPDKATLRAYDVVDILFPEKPYLDRNKDIVNAVDLMLGFPKEMEDVLRSGTWSTIRYAKKKKVPVVTFYPDGTKQFDDE